MSASADRDGQHRYIVRFSDGGSGMRWYDDPLTVGAEIRDGGDTYRVARVDAPRTITGLGHAWCETISQHDASASAS